MAPSLLMLVPSFLKFIFSEIQYIKMYLYGEKNICSESEGRCDDKKKKKAVISPGSSWSIFQSLSQENKQVQMESASSDTLNY